MRARNTRCHSRPDWAGTLRGDYYWQDYSWARVFNDNPYDRLRGYTNVNLTLIFTNQNGWQVMLYDKNVFNDDGDHRRLPEQRRQRTDDERVSDRSQTDRHPRHKELVEGEPMSETTNTRMNGRNFRRKLLTTACALALLIAFQSAPKAEADEESSGPSFWIELGGQWARTDGGPESFAPPFASEINTKKFTSLYALQKPSLYAIGEEEKYLSRQKIRIGCSAPTFNTADRVSRNVHQEGPREPLITFESVPPFNFYAKVQNPPYATDFVNAVTRNHESHDIIDFQVGKDVGMGLFGRGATSFLNAGIRFAQFSSGSSASIDAIPDFTVTYKYAG